MLTSKHWLIRQESALSKVFSLHTVKSTYLPDLDFLTSKISEHHLETSSTQVKTLILYVVEFLKKKKKINNKEYVSQCLQEEDLQSNSQFDSV